MAIGSNLPAVDPQPLESSAPVGAPEAEAAPVEEPPAEISTTDQASLSGEADTAPEVQSQISGFNDNFGGTAVAEASVSEEKPRASKNSLISTTSASEARTRRQDNPNRTDGSQVRTSNLRSRNAAQDPAQKLLESREAPLSTQSGVQLDEQGQIKAVGHASGQTFEFGQLGPDGRVDQVKLGTGETFRREGADWTMQTADGQSQSWKGDFATDKDGNVTVTQNDGSTTRFGADGGTQVRDAQGQLQQEQKVEAFADGRANLRDGQNRLTHSFDKEGGARSLQYNEQGQITAFDYKSRTDSLGMQRQLDGSWKDQQGNTLRGAFTVGETGDITFKNEDGSSRTWERNGNQVVRQGEQVTATVDARGRQTGYEYGPGNQLTRVTTPDGTMEFRDGKWTGQAPPALLGKVDGKGPADLSQLNGLKVGEDGTLSASFQNDRRQLLVDGGSVLSDARGTQAAAYNEKGQLTEVRAGEKSTTFGYDEQGKLNEVGYNGRIWERGAARDGHHRWHSQDGQGFTGSVKADSREVSFQQFDPATGKSTISSHDLSGEGGRQRSFDRHNRLTAETRFNADGSRQDRIFDDQGKDTNHYLRTDKNGQRTYGEFGQKKEHRVDPVSAELNAYGRTLDNHGEARPPFNAEKSAENLYRALDGADDEAAIFNELAGRSPEELRAIQDSFQGRYDYTLRSDLKSDLSGSDEARALAYLDGNHAKGDAIGLHENMEDMKAVENLLQRQRSPEDVRAIEAAYQRHYQSDYRKDFNSTWSGYTHQIQANSALLAGDRTRAAAARAAYSVRNQDAEGLYSAITREDGKSLSRESRLALKEQYSQLTGGKNLAFDIDRNLVGNQNRRGLALNFGDDAGAEAARARSAMKGNESGGFYGLFEGWGTDEKALERGYERRPGESEADWKARQEAVNSRYQQSYGTGRWEDVKGETSGTDRSRLESLKANGQLSAAERIYTATVGAGTTEDELKAVLQNASTDEMKALRADYARRYPGRELDQDVLGDVSGRLHHDASQWLRGMPDREKDPAGHFAEQMYRLNDTHAYERQGWQNAVGTTVTDRFSSAGGRADARHQKLQGLYDQARADHFKGAKAREFELELNRARADLNHYRESKDSVTEGAATVVTSAAAVGAVVLTAGAATPVVAAAAIGAGAGSNLATRAAMGGKEYTLGAAVKDTALGGVDGATTLLVPGLGKAASPLLKTGLGQSAEKLAVKAFSNPVAQRTALGLADGALSGATSTAAYAVADDRTWDEGGLQGMKNVLNAGLQGGTVGALTGGVTANAVPAVVSKGQQVVDNFRLNSMNSRLDEAGREALGGLRERLGDRAAADMLGNRGTTLKDDIGHLQRTLDGLPAHDQQLVSRTLQEVPELRKNLLDGRSLEGAIEETIKSHPDKVGALQGLREQLGALTGSDIVPPAGSVDLETARTGLTRQTLGASGQPTPTPPKGQEHLAQIDRGLKAAEEIVPGFRQKMDQLLSPEPSVELAGRRQALADEQAQLFSGHNQKLQAMSEEAVRAQYGQQGVEQRQQLLKRADEITAERGKIDAEIEALKSRNLERAEVLADSFLKRLRGDQSVVRNAGQAAQFDASALNKMKELNTERVAENARRQAQGKPPLPELTPETTRQWINDFYQKTGLTAPDRLKFAFSEGRPHYNPDTDTINIGNTWDKHMLHHELAHRVEYLHPEISQANKAWVEARARATGYDPTDPARLDELVKGVGYGPDEKAIQDSFKNPYVGRVYPDQATEVLSTGLEHFSDGRRAAQLYQEDPEQFMMTLGALRQAHELGRPDAVPVRRVSGPVAGGAIEPPADIQLSQKIDPDMTFQDYRERPRSLTEKFFGRKLPAYVGTPETPVENASMTRMLSESVEKYYGRSHVPAPDHNVTVPVKDLIFAQGKAPTVNHATLSKYLDSGNFGQELIHIPTPDGSKYLVIEGHHRSSAAMLNGDEVIEPGRVYQLNEVAGLMLAGYHTKQDILEAVNKHTRHLWVVDRVPQ